MKQKKNCNVYYILCLLFICICLSGLAACSPADDTTARTGTTSSQEQKSILHVQSSWRQYTFEEAVETAPTIVLGTVTAKSDTQIQESTASNGVINQTYYRNVTVTIDELCKGDSALTSVVYKESGGETDTLICIYDGVEAVEPGDQVLLFLNQYGYPLTPSGLRIADEEGSISVSSDWLPVSAGQPRSAPPSYTTMPIEDYCGIIRDYLAQ